MQPILPPDGWTDRNLEPGQYIEPVTIGPPPGVDAGTIHGMVRRHSEDGRPVRSFLWEFDDEERKYLAGGGLVLLTFDGPIPVHMMQVVGT